MKTCTRSTATPLNHGNLTNRKPPLYKRRSTSKYMNRIGGGEDPILASQLADLRKRQQDEEAATIEQLSRYGVLRGGGDTASALMEMREGQSRNRLALEAAAAQRQQQDLRDALGFDQARSQQGFSR